jgi:hypothetical protein
VSVKVGVADGGVDVSQVIAAVNWIVRHRNDNGLNIRVINLSYGTNSTQKYDLDPLAFAVEQAWKKGIVVVGEMQLAPLLTKTPAAYTQKFTNAGRGAPGPAALGRAPPGLPAAG